MKGLRKRIVSATNRAVIKVGSSLLVSLEEGIKKDYVRSLAHQLAQLRNKGVEVLLVSSGAIAAGMERLGMKDRPSSISEQQATAAVGQGLLMHLYEEAFEDYGLKVAQVLLTHEDVRDRRRYLNARNTLLTLLRFGVVPIINENDSVVIDEIKLGDNDLLAALTAGLTESQLLVILTDVEGLYEGGPGGRLIKVVERIEDDLEASVGGTTTKVGTGGMVTKIQAAKLASKIGVYTIVAKGTDAQILQEIWMGKEVGTLFLPEARPLTGRKKWIGFNVKVKGTLVVDEGAMVAVLKMGKSLLPSGVKEVLGDFQRGDAVLCRGPDGRDFAKGLVNYSSAEIAAIKGHKTQEIEAILGYKYAEEVIHRDNLVLL